MARKDKKGMNIVDDSGVNASYEKKKKLAIFGGVAITIAAVVGISIVCFNFLGNKTPDDYEQYEKIAKIYEEKDIEYSYEDWKTDQKAANESKDKDSESKENESNSPKLNNIATSSNTSNATQQLISGNDKVLQDAEENSMIKIDTAGLIQSIYDQTVSINNFIDNHCGYGEGEYADSIYDGVREYVDQLAASLSGRSAPENIYDYSIEQQQAEMRYCIFERVTFVGGNNYPQYNDIYSNYLAIGHPIISNISTISVEELEGEWFDDVYLANLKATVSANGGVYEIYMASQIIDGGESLYQILDVR